MKVSAAGSGASAAAADPDRHADAQDLCFRQVERATIDAIGGEIKSVGFLASDAPLQWQQSDAGLQLKLSVRPAVKHAIVLKVTGDRLALPQ